MIGAVGVDFGDMRWAFLFSRRFRESGNPGLQRSVARPGSSLSRGKRGEWFHVTKIRARAARKIRALVLAATGALLLTGGTGMAQSAGTGIGATTLGIPGDMTPTVSGSGIPLGATELGGAGLSLSPFSVPGSGSHGASPLAMLGAAGFDAVATGGLSPGVTAPQCAMPSTSFC